MSSFTTKTPPPYLRRSNDHRRINPLISIICSVGESQQDSFTRRRTLTSLITLTAIGAGAIATSSALAQEKWGTRSFIKEKYFQPGLSPEDAAARIKQTAEGLRDMREMLDHMSWRYVIFYIRLKQAYLSQDLTNAMNILPESRRNDYVQAANQLVSNMSEWREREIPELITTSMSKITAQKEPMRDPEMRSQNPSNCWQMGGQLAVVFPS